MMVELFLIFYKLISSWKLH